MNRALKKALAGLLAFGVGFLHACGPQPAEDSPQPSEPTQTEAPRTWPPVVGSELPIESVPALIGQGDTETTCPYLDAQWVENTNGQRWTGTGVDTQFDTPACIFWSYEDQP